jgi:PHD/YefM family antitoxin component YafN of YafNO toxin-antitoxin module
MIAIQKKLVVDEQGDPQEVIISWKQYQEIIEMLGLDLDEEAIADLHQARRDRMTQNRDAYVSLDALGG